MAGACLLLALLLSGSALAEPIRLKLATPAPEGSAYARELHGFSRQVESARVEDRARGHRVVVARRLSRRASSAGPALMGDT
jgi:hypothetical protein